MDSKESEKPKQGAFIASLKRSNKSIRDDRAASIVDIAEMKFKRRVEDVELALKQMRMEQDNLLDLSPTNATSLIVASDFNADEYVSKEEALALKIRNEEIRLSALKKRYKVLFIGESGDQSKSEE